MGYPAVVSEPVLALPGQTNAGSGEAGGGDDDETPSDSASEVAPPQSRSASGAVRSAAGAHGLMNLKSRYFVMDAVRIKEDKWDGRPLEALALSGGGIKGIAFGGAVQRLEEAGLFAGIKHFAGTSAGSCFASLLAVGYSGKEVSDILATAPIGKTMMAGRWNCLWRLYKRSGLYTLGPFIRFMDQLFWARTRLRMITFQQLYELRGVILVIPSINIKEKTLVYLSHETQPHMPVALACAASSAAPIMFEPIEWKGTCRVRYVVVAHCTEACPRLVHTHSTLPCAKAPTRTNIA